MSLCSCGISVMYCADSGEVTYEKHFRWHTWHQSCCTNIYPLHIKYQISCTFVHWVFHSNKYLTTNSWTVNFPHPVLHISRPIILIEFPRVTAAFVATVWQICLSAIFLLTIVGNWNLRCLQNYDVISRPSVSWSNVWSQRTYTEVTVIWAGKWSAF